MKKEIFMPFMSYFQKRGSGFILSNDEGQNILLKEKDFIGFIKGKLKNGRLERELSKKNFFQNRLNLDLLAERWGERFLKDWRGPHVHIISVTKRCDAFCSYCGANAASKNAFGNDMSMEAAKKTVDFIFDIENKDLMIEFQGGEPILNFKIVRFIINYAKKKNKIKKRNLHFSIVTNLVSMSNKKMEFLVKNNVTVCSSLDGPAFLHNSNRKLLKGTAHKKTAEWLKKTVSLSEKNKNFELPNAICTISRSSLKYPREIVDEFLKCGLERVQLGPLDPLGRAKSKWDTLGYGANEFLSFYKKAFNYILLLNKKGISVYEKGALMFIKQILTGERPRYQNLDFVYRLAYNYDGGIYGSDEARMLSNSKDEFFKLGNVFKDSFSSILKKPLSKMLFLAAFNSLSQPKCARCAYSPYCHIMPAYNYSAQGGFWGNMTINERCKIFNGVFNIMIDKMRSSENKKIFALWIDKYR